MNSPLVRPWIIAPLKPSFVTVRSSSSAAAFGSGVGRMPKAVKRFGLAFTISARRSFVWRAMREYLHVDARFVHFLDAQGRDVLQPFLDLRQALAFAAGKMRNEIDIPIVLFEGNNK